MQASDIISVNGDRLKPFQVEAVDRLEGKNFAINADDMGLGKTVQGIALDLLRRAKHPGSDRLCTLVLCPMSVIDVWEEHFAAWQPNLKVKTIDRKDRKAFEEAVKEKSYDVYIMHWDVVRLLPELRRRKWFHIIADEAHRVGNRDAQVTVKSKQLQWQYLTELTGTPATSRPEQFWSLLNWGHPVRFRSYWRFYNHHVIYQAHDTSGDCRAVVNGFQCGKEHKHRFNVVLGIDHVDELLGEIKPYYVRRLKEEVLDDLPEKYYTTIKVDLHPQQRRVYNQMRDEMLAWVGEHQDQPMAAPVAVAKLVRLQQLACAYADIVPVTVRKKHAHKPSRMVDGKQRGCTDDCKQTWDEVKQDKVRLVEPSSKLDAVMEILDANPDKQFVVFSQSKQVINLFAARLHKANITHAILTGDTPQADRGEMVRMFQAGKIRIFAGTIAAGGVGITLTAASTVIFLDRSWSPAINRQAEDRLHRIGQKNAVQVIDIVARNTVDQGRLQRLETTWFYIKKLLGDADAVQPKPEGAYI